MLEKHKVHYWDPVGSLKDQGWAWTPMVVSCLVSRNPNNVISTLKLIQLIFSCGIFHPLALTQVNAGEGAIIIIRWRIAISSQPNNLWTQDQSVKWSLSVMVQ